MQIYSSAPSPRSVCTRQATRCPDAKNIVGLCDIFGVSCDYLLCQTDYRRPENERLTIEEMGYSEKAAQKLNDLDLFKVRDKSTHVELPFSPKGSFNLLVEDSLLQQNDADDK